MAINKDHLGGTIYTLDLTLMEKQFSGREFISQLEDRVWEDLVEYFSTKVKEKMVPSIANKLETKLPELIEKLGKDIVVKGIASLVAEEVENRR